MSLAGAGKLGDPIVVDAHTNSNNNSNYNNNSNNTNTNTTTNTTTNITTNTNTNNTTTNTTSTTNKTPSRPPWYPPMIDTSSSASRGVLMLQNTLTGRKEPFVPKNGRTVRWYTCGPTVYDSSHVGHARTYLSLDILRRIMSDYFHYNLVYQINITDIDDKIILRSRQQHLWEQLRRRVLESSETTPAELQTLVQTSIDNAQAAAASKQAAIEAALETATEAGDSRAVTEQTNLLQQQNVKTANLQAEVTRIQAVLTKDTTDDNSAALLDAARSVLSEQLDRDQGHSVTDHAVFNEHARKYEREFMEDMAALGIREPDVLTRVTEYVPHIQDFIQKIIDRDIAYASPTGSVYLSLTQFQAAGHYYRKLVPAAAGTATTAAELAESEGALQSATGTEKRHPNDFCLWKASKPGEPAWESPWGPGRPGWHIECSVIATDILGENLDIHAGGEDLKFPHHDNELAQSEAALGCGCRLSHEDHDESYDKSQECHQWVNYFIHTGHLHIEGLKMSKSLKNFVTIKQALAKNSPRLLRILFLLKEWDGTMNYSQETTQDARTKEATFKSFFREVEAICRTTDYLADEIGWRNPVEDRALADALAKAQQTVHECLLDNFNTRGAMLALLAVISHANVYLRTPKVQDQPAVLLLQSIAVYVTQILKVFGVVTGQDDFGFESGSTSSNDAAGDRTALIGTLVSFREQVRNRALAAVKDSTDPQAALQAILRDCDWLRDETLPQHGIRAEDRPGGTRWNAEDPATLMRELAEKKAHQAAALRGKLEKALAAKERELTKLQESLVVPANLFRDDKYKEWNDQGVPTVLADGTAVAKSQIKKMTKAVEKQQKLYDDAMKKSNGQPDQLVETLQGQMQGLRDELAGLAPA